MSQMSNFENSNWRTTAVLTRRQAVAIPHMSFHISGPLERSLYLKPFSRYCAKRIRVTSSTFQGLVTSSVTWPYDSS